MQTEKMTRLARAAHLGQRGMTLLEILIVLAIIAVVMGFLVGPQVMKMFGESKVETAGIMTRKLAYEAYPRWQMDTGEQCPSSLSDLEKYLNTPDIKDPWGNEYVLLCGDSAPPEAGGFGVISFGPDGKQGTDDDLKSWERRKK